MISAKEQNQNTEKESESSLTFLSNIRPQNAITHSNKAPKKTVSVTWEAPDDLDTDVVFLVSVVQSFDTFWVGVPSETVALAKEPTAEPEPEAEPKPTAEPEPEPEPEHNRDADDNKPSSATLTHAGVALLIAPLAIAALHRLQ